MSKNTAKVNIFWLIGLRIVSVVSDTSFRRVPFFVAALSLCYSITDLIANKK